MACPLCEGTGWQSVDVDDRRRVKRCVCWLDSLGARLVADARVPRRYQHCDLDRFETYGNASLVQAVTHARRLAEAFPVVDRGLFLLGPPGVGKTHLAVAVLKQVARTRGARGVFYDTRELLRLIRSTFDSFVRERESDVLRPVLAADLLVLDDLGAEKTSEWVDETLNFIVNHRYSEQRTTIFTSNYDIGDATDPDSLQVRVGFRMYSRLHEMCEFLHLDGADYRELPENGGPDDLKALWTLRKKPQKRALPSRAGAPARAHLKDGRADLKWAGGRAGTS